jgi:hypothetical protein
MSSSTSRDAPHLHLVVGSAPPGDAPRRAVPAAALVGIAAAKAGESRPPMPRRHKLMLLLAFEVLVFGFAQAEHRFNRHGITIEMSITPNHVVT